MGRDHPPVDVSAVNTQDRGGSLTVGRHAHKSPSPGFIATVMLHDVRRFHAAKRFKYRAQIVAGNVARQIAYADIHSAPLFFAASTCVARRAKPKRNDSGDGVLRRVMLSQANHRASWLHQAIILGSR
jgi:hypothetical protein